MASFEHDERAGGTAAALRRLAAQAGGPRLSVDDIVRALGDQGFGLLILLLALPNLVPGPPVPGFSVPFALGIAVLGLQLIVGCKTPVLPGWIRRRSIRRDGFRRFVAKAEPKLLRIERWLKPRPSALTDGTGERLVGAALVAMSLVLALPVPLGNGVISISIAVVALGLLEGDGTALKLGLVVGILSMIWNAVLVAAGARLVEALIAYAAG